jgi:hypothetical protein
MAMKVSAPDGVKVSQQAERQARLCVSASSSKPAAAAQTAAVSATGCLLVPLQWQASQQQQQCQQQAEPVPSSLYAGVQCWCWQDDAVVAVRGEEAGAAQGR